MSVPALSLVGFMTEEQAHVYLLNQCILLDQTERGRSSIWNAAKKKLGRPPAPNPGKPLISDIQVKHKPYVDEVEKSPRFAETVKGMPWSFKLVEIDPLLAFQHHVETGRSANLCASINGIPRVEEMLNVTLPLDVEPIPFNVVLQPNSLVIRYASNNLRTSEAGVFTNEERRTQVAGLQFAAASPLVQVVHFEDRYYLKNGFHRAYGLRRAGATQMPCILLDADDYAKVGAPGNGATFEQDLLEGADPPTCGHFTQGRAYDVKLRTVSRFIHVTWSEYAYPDEG